MLFEAGISLGLLLGATSQGRSWRVVATTRRELETL